MPKAPPTLSNCNNGVLYRNDCEMWSVRCNAAATIPTPRAVRLQRNWKTCEQRLAQTKLPGNAQSKLSYCFMRNYYCEVLFWCSKLCLPPFSFFTQPGLQVAVKKRDEDRLFAGGNQGNPAGDGEEKEKREAFSIRTPVSGVCMAALNFPLIGFIVLTADRLGKGFSILLKLRFATLFY